MTARRRRNPAPVSLDTLAVLDPKETRRRSVRRANAARAIRLGVSRNLRHGVYSELAVKEDVLDECALLYARAQWLDAVRDGLLVEATARLIVRLRKLDIALDDDPTSQTLTTLYARLEGQLMRNCDALGLTPRAAAALGITKLDAGARFKRMSEQGLRKYALSDDDP
jgi:hypothetical protein